MSSTSSRRSRSAASRPRAKSSPSFARASAKPKTEFGTSAKISGRRTRTALTKATRGSGNVFADLALPDAPELMVRADLVLRIGEILAARGLTQAEAAALFGVDQPTVSNLLRGRLDRFSLERLFRFLEALGQVVEIRVVPRASGQRRTGVRVTS